MTIQAALASSADLSNWLDSSIHGLEVPYRKAVMAWRCHYGGHGRVAVANALPRSHLRRGGRKQGDFHLPQSAEATRCCWSAAAEVTYRRNALARGRT